VYVCVCVTICNEIKHGKRRKNEVRGNLKGQQRLQL
jgi:hypothetical protein